ncbi:MAG: FAD-binding protein, partial [Burkholderiaceae bacterium]
MTDIPTDPALLEIRERIRAAAADGASLVLRGGDTKAFYGEPVAGDRAVLDLSGYRGIVSYEPTELVVTARCGTPLAEV